MTTPTPSFFGRFWNKFKKDPFATIDTLDLYWHGFQFNILKDDKKLCDRFILPVVVLIPLLCWVLLGPDSTAEQVAFFVWNLPAFLLRKITFNQWVHTYTDYYGLGTHWSAAVIYGLLFVGLSRYFRETDGVENSENLCFTAGCVGLTIAFFEFFWMNSYFIFQNQHWILSLRWPQFRIIVQNLIFLSPGLVILFGFNWKKYKLNLSWKTILCLALTCGFVLLWWFYPFPVERLTVQIEGLGMWTSSLNFPQTMYTIDMDLTDGLAVGDMFHVDDPAVHLVNNLTKIFMTLFFYNLFKVQHRKKWMIEEYEIIMER